jgi:hypothetical protein
VRELIGPLDAGGRAGLDHRITLPAGSAVARSGVAIFVEQADTGTILQAAARYPLC